ncbi:DUF937 domain-containing protein [Formosa algae]|uniref:DUF937 domain-containing protein n=1 Tax=Formosa algae TaxID=225843 RepID=A0A9X0YLI5_9FLAO|nr:DUF937 domain-containing protein [Formosa algae]MBP1840806.1 hypothetical protein [Formosa algae]MDQ0336297.1 hypothetical protein [Formosa algae]OEI80324.1 hypothetical protein AST99_09905 [Formosa algae]PNW28758.1 hypothetical protein BKP44_07550 [Formosa algae]
MSGILDLLNSDLGKSVVSGLANQSGQDSSKTSDLLTMALPLLTQAMTKNAQASPEGAEGLLNALSGSKHDGSILNNLDGFFNGGVDEAEVEDGKNILNHVLGSKQQNVELALSQKTGIDASSVSQILKMATPILMSYLGKQQRENNVSSTSDLSGMLGGLFQGNSAEGEQNFLTSILDADGDGSIVDDVAGMFLDSKGSKSSSGGIGDVLGGFLK